MSKNYGTCVLCKHETSKGQMTRHVLSCASANSPEGPTEEILQLRVDSADDPMYWLHVEVRARSSFQQLDSLLRRTWLECCGHLSEFRLGRRELSLSAPIGRELPRVGAKFAYEYDFGSTTALRGQVVGVRVGRLGRAASRIVARNNPLLWSCADCERPALIVCPLCIYEDSYLFCETHAETHACADEEAYLPVVNSPRMGVCGYAAGQVTWDALECL